MRYGVISDVHGNLHALRAVVADLRHGGVDGWLSVGDLVGYGPHPNECVELVASLPATAVAGNHELIVLGQIPGRGSSERAQRSHYWTRQALREDVVAYLQALPRRAELGDVIVTHGSLHDPEEYVRTPAQAAEQLALLAHEHPQARMLIVGNTHRQLLYSERMGQRAVSHHAPLPLLPAQRSLVNPGSVGQSRQWEWPPRARALILDLDDEQLWFRRVGYDLAACRRDLLGQNLPYQSIHTPRPLRATIRGRVIHTLHRLQHG